ncbi:hypothetical protein D0869_05602 [Hortaea werneckii]|uniref:Uncharacterized protein n=1 Tax=Hortaea werneckii TaxID=91943 RepID=A0A3M6WWR0_HORWE|nr:hypothetical protein KC324_g6404 [Hortaea werneckii]KAI7585005.1 hypothetical protein KC316_g6386 [Hortaea werneckii]RMX83053.1 hypothetical protein D0869_05602 [Hortaea werneckii]RMY12175.1 hypothetical protein D0868_02722 [Hortaea werneckii]
MPRQLTINPAPFKSSNLAIPPSPFSPKLPLSPTELPYRRQSPATKFPISSASPPPSDPLHWLWQCHICNRVYQLDVTRRCLDDGHFFCSGTTTIKRSRKSGQKVLRHKACASEFDYQGWKAWGIWRREVAEQARLAEALMAAAAAEEDSDSDHSVDVPSASSESEWMKGAWAGSGRRLEALKISRVLPRKHCWNTCDYPSECRWGKQYGVLTPVKATDTVPSSQTSDLAPVEEAESQQPKTTFDDILLDSSIIEDSTAQQIERCQPTKQTTGKPETPGGENTRKPSMDDLLESVKRRKRKSLGQTPSPLASHPPSPTSTEAPEVVTTETTTTLLPAESAEASANYLQKALDDFELDVRKSLERAGDLVTSWASNLKTTAALEEEKGVASVKGLRVQKKNKGPFV